MSVLGDQEVQWGKNQKNKAVTTADTKSDVIETTEITGIRNQIEQSIKLALDNANQLYAVTPNTDLYSMIIDLELLIMKLNKI